MKFFLILASLFFTSALYAEQNGDLGGELGAAKYFNTIKNNAVKLNTFLNIRKR